MKKLLLTDGNSMLFRAYYATAYGRPMTTSDGTPTNAVFGFASMMQKAIDIIQPDAVLVAFDAGKHTFRHELYADYKGGRKPAPDDLVPQFKLVRDFLDAFAITWVEMQDIEADDLIGTISKKATDYQTYVLTSDHDMLQLVDDTTSVLLMKKGITDMDVMTPESLKEQMGIEPLQIIDMKGLMGDKSDNIPGIPGIGEKTALKLLEEYGTVENVLANEDKLKGALQKKVMEGHESALLSKKLATIRRDVDVEMNEKELSFTPNYPQLVKFLQMLEMNTLAKRFSDKIVAEKSTQEETVVTSSEDKRVTKVPTEMLKDACAVFVDDDHGAYMHATINGFALYNGKQAIYISLPDAKRDEDLLAYLSSDIPHKYGFDVKRNLHLAQNEGLTLTFHDDMMLAAALVDSSLTTTTKIIERYGFDNTVSYEDVYGKPTKPNLMIDEEKQCMYACAFAKNIFSLYAEITPKLQEYKMEKLYYEMEMPLTHVLYHMEREGIRCDIDILDRIATETMAKISEAQKEIYAIAGKEFNINSPKQLAEVLFDDLGLPTGKKRSTAAGELEKLQGKSLIIDYILDYRKLSKIYSTYAEGLKKYIQKDGKIHTIYNQSATQTGRLSSSEPNLQNISVRDEQGKEIRKAFLPEDGCVLISSDYHQIELRMLAHMANETSLIEAFKEGIDIHTKTAMDVFHKPQDEITPQDRRSAKTVNFGIVYGISDFGLSEQLGVSRYEAHDFIERYYAAYPKIRTYMDKIVKDCEEKGYVETLCGRRREIPEIHDKNHATREFGKRAAMNAPIQGSAADLIKLAMIHINQMMKEAKVKSKMILQVHDELIFNVPKEEVEVMTKLINDGMVNAMHLQVPLTAECSIGSDWYEAK